MLIKIKNKETLILNGHSLKCSIGEKGINPKKKEGDKCTPKGQFTFGKVYYRPDKIKKPKTKLTTKKIKKNMGWCDDINSKFYNKEIKTSTKTTEILNIVNNNLD